MHHSRLLRLVTSSIARSRVAAADLGIVEHLFRRAVGDHLTKIENDATPAQPQDRFDIVLDHDHGEMPFLVQPRDHLRECPLSMDLEPSQHFVEHQKLGTGGERLADFEPFLLAEREPGRGVGIALFLEVEKTQIASICPSSTAPARIAGPQ